jgi:hypothetical protein
VALAVGQRDRAEFTRVLVARQVATAPQTAEIAGLLNITERHPVLLSDRIP